jgi:hypothetical protein
MNPDFEIIMTDPTWMLSHYPRKEFPDESEFLNYPHTTAIIA